MAKLPEESRAMRMGPDLSEALTELLAPYEGDQGDLAQMAVREVYASGFTGTHVEVVEAYRTAVEEAVAV